uniref:J domain-containing protein n=1 Tax=Araucaria cunninghamii TaxID=56994 RepID=A0A0D6R935_ARACU
MDSGEDDKEKKAWSRNHHGNSWNHVDEERENGMRIWGIVFFGLIGATATTYAVGQARRSLEWVYSQVNRAKQSQYSWKQGGESGSQQSARTREESWNRYNQRLREDYEEEMERVERIRRMQGVFNRERSKYQRSYEKWYENASDAYRQQNFQREDWYWKTDKAYKERIANERKARMRASGNYALAHHYEVLGLNMSRAEPYSEAEIKVAFRVKAKEYHPDQNPKNKEAAEEKFKEVMVSYEALKLEQKNK